MLNHFVQNDKELKYFKVSKLDALVKTQKEANEILQEILDLAKNSRSKE